MYLYYVGKYASTQNWVLEERERERERELSMF